MWARKIINSVRHGVGKIKRTNSSYLVSMIFIFPLLKNDLVSLIEKWPITIVEDRDADSYSITK